MALPGPHHGTALSPLRRLPLIVRTSIRLLLLLDALALGVASGAAVLALGLPLAARRLLGASEIAGISAGVALFVAGTAALLLFRSVGRPVGRLLEAAARLGPGTTKEALPILGDAEDAPQRMALSRAAVAFERLTVELHEERARLSAKVAELTRTNRALEEAKDSLVRSEKLATVGRLAAGLAHEVGNPLGAIQGYADLASRRLSPSAHPDLVDALARIGSEAQRIDQTVRDLLDFARPSASLLAPIDLSAAIDASVRLARVQSRFHGVDVQVELEPGLPRVLAEERQLAQVLLNLLLNAGDAMGGAGSVRISARPEEGGRVLLTVADTGPGMAPADLPRIFDPFFTTKDPGQGTGLGLAISHRIMESFGGGISARNGDGGGALFELTLRGEPPSA